MNHSHMLLFDTNVFKKLIAKGNEDIFEQIFLRLNDIENPSNKYTGFYATTSPFQFLEFLGRLPPKIEIDAISDEDVEKHGSEITRVIFDRAKSVYQNHDDLSEASLKERNIKNKAILSAKAIPLYRDMVDNLTLRKDFTAELKSNLAMDYTYRYPYSKILKGDDIKRVHINSMLDIYRAHNEQVNYTQSRGVLKFCEDLERAFGRKKMGEKLRELLDATKGIKEFRDLVDLDLIQFACLGAFTAKQKLPTIILTGDSKESVVKRIRLFKTAFIIFDNKLRSESYFEKNTSISSMGLLEGKIFFVDMGSWQISEVLDVSTIAAEVDDEEIENPVS